MINKIQCRCYSCHHLSNKTRYQLFYYPNLTITVNWRSLGCGQNKTFEDVTFRTWGHFIDQKNNCLTKKQQRQWLLVAAQLSTLCTAQFNDCVIFFFSVHQLMSFVSFLRSWSNHFYPWIHCTKQCKWTEKETVILRKRSDLCSAYADWKCENLNFRCWQETPSLRWNAKHSLMVGWGAQQGFRKVSVLYSLRHTQKTHYDTSQEGKSLRCLWHDVYVPYVEHYASVGSRSICDL